LQQQMLQIMQMERTVPPTQLRSRGRRPYGSILNEADRTGMWTAGSGQ
jgi:hypothetical protein